jgi:hypothetical protein
MLAGSHFFQFERNQYMNGENYYEQSSNETKGVLHFLHGFI